MESINIAIATDNTYAQHACVEMASILCNTAQKEKIRFFLLSDDIEDDKKEAIVKTVQNLGAAISIHELSGDKRFEGLYVRGKLTRTVYFRLALPDIMPEDVHKIIYLDSDMLVFGDISELWSTDVEKIPLAAVPDYGIMSSARLWNEKESFIGMKKDGTYFNSGVLVINLNMWKEHDLGHELLSLVREEQYPHLDQDSLNKIFMDNWISLPLKWNIIPPIFYLFWKRIFLNPKLRAKALEARKDIRIIHYAGRYKPWEFERHEGFNSQYYKYLAMTEFKNVKMPQLAKDTHSKSINRQLIRLKIAEMLCRVF